MSFTLSDLSFARHFLTWAANTRRINWAEFNWLMHSVTYHERRAARCQGKERFNTFAAADKVAKFTRRDGHVHLMAYHCNVCGFSHVATRQPERRRSGERLFDIRAGREHGGAT